jgi:ribonuclease VapC
LTIVVDTSALVAIVFDEPDAPLFQSILETEEPLLSFGSRVELTLVLGGRLREKAEPEIAEIIRTYGISVVPGDEAQVTFAAEGFRRFGKGRGAEGSFLNYGDLFAYALAKARDLPLLYKGNDFVRTDVRPAL